MMYEYDTTVAEVYEPNSLLDNIQSIIAVGIAL